MSILRWSLMLILGLTTLFVNAAPTRVMNDLTQFDHPLLLGDWYVVSDGEGEVAKSYKAIRLNFDSHYEFIMQIYKHDSSIEYWYGKYQVDKQVIRLTGNGIEPQEYAFSTTHNKLMLNGITFYKGNTIGLAGVWQSETLTGQENELIHLKTMTLVLQPDFVFMIKVIDANGNEAIHQGIYFTEGQHLVLLYQNGGHDTQFTLSENTMTLNVEQGAVEAVLARLQ